MVRKVIVALAAGAFAATLTLLPATAAAAVESGDVSSVSCADVTYAASDAVDCQLDTLALSSSDSATLASTGGDDKTLGIILAAGLGLVGATLAVRAWSRLEQAT